MVFSEKDFHVLDVLDREEISTQRQLSEHSGISLGQVNYIIKSLLEKGLVKIGRFRKNPHKIGYMYLLTPKGIETKSRLAVKFIVSKLKEYDTLRMRLAERLTVIEKNGHTRLIFVGPSIVKHFVDSIIDERGLKLILVGHYQNWKDLKKVESKSFDVALLFDGNSVGVRKIADATEISREKVLTLW